ncbi:hypothetical protein KI614_09415 [Dechloromonas denitrificans]|uniref:hypothetical protein n=1 Tax=Dechloromonas denitrificans TaxID=281362 RepID=UPI001CF7EFBB|nr:hypothetical protein [Dechloromonas denitrificans]UCV10425.1 hypothetical protein KI614_09415 [Dechloromonas denitrificans]
MLLEMPRTSPYLKGLAETRARVDADYVRASERLTSANHQLKQARALVARLEKAIPALQTQVLLANTTRYACDTLIVSLNPDIEPAEIQPIRAWQGRYGKRGTLGQLVQAIIETAYPEPITTIAVAQQLETQLNLTFATPADRAHWMKATVNARLNYLGRTGVIERLHPATAAYGKPGIWRGKPHELYPSLNALATHAGLATTSAPEQNDLELVLEPAPEEDDLPR